MMCMKCCHTCLL